MTSGFVSSAPRRARPLARRLWLPIRQAVMSRQRRAPSIRLGLSFLCCKYENRAIRFCGASHPSEGVSCNDGSSHRGSGHDRVPEESVLRTRRQATAFLRRLFGNFRPRQCRWPRPGARTGSRIALLPLPQRASHGPCRDGFRKNKFPSARAGLHILDRSGRDQHDHRRGHCHRQSPARPASARRYFCAP
jgi:hypothetical protein